MFLTSKQQILGVFTPGSPVDSFQLGTKIAPFIPLSAAAVHFHTALWQTIQTSVKLKKMTQKPLKIPASKNVNRLYDLSFVVNDHETVLPLVLDSCVCFSRECPDTVLFLPLDKSPVRLMFTFAFEPHQSPIKPD